MSEIAAELAAAEAKHPVWPASMFHKLSIMQEEAGEVAKAMNDYCTGKATMRDIRMEVIQTAAMCIRMLKNLPEE